MALLLWNYSYLPRQPNANSITFVLAFIFGSSNNKNKLKSTKTNKQTKQTIRVKIHENFIGYLTSKSSNGENDYLSGI